VRITAVGACSTSWTSFPAHGYAIYPALLTPTRWGVSPAYNYSIPYASATETGWEFESHPSPVDGEVILPQSDSTYIAVECGQYRQTAYAAANVTGGGKRW